MIDETIKKLTEITESIIKKEWIQNQFKGYGSCGMTFESEIGLSPNNIEIADYNGIEIKTKFSTIESHIKLLGISPDNSLFEIQRIYETYGYNKSFNVSIYAHKKIYYKNHYYQLKIDKINKKIILMIYDKNKNLIDDNIFWSFELIKEKINRKIRKLFLVYGQRKYENKIVYYRYNKYNYYEFKNFDFFIKAIEKGNIRISFSIGTVKSGKRKGHIYDHGTNFNISTKKLEEIYTKII